VDLPLTSVKVGPITAGMVDMSWTFAVAYSFAVCVFLERKRLSSSSRPHQSAANVVVAIAARRRINCSS
jgi:hypothetical protein